MRELVKKGAISTKDSREMVKKLLKEASNERKRIQKFGQQEANRIVKKMGMVSKREVNSLSKRINALEMIAFALMLSRSSEEICLTAVFVATGIKNGVLTSPDFVCKIPHRALL